MNKVRIFIPARMQSSRLPNKPLKLIKGKTLIERVYDNAISTGFPVTVLTDTMEILNKYPTWDVRITGDCRSGTDRVSLVAKDYKEEYFINCQGDLPFITSEQIRSVLKPFSINKDGVATLITQLKEQDKLNPNTVKAIASKIHHDIYKIQWCGRFPVPYGYQHIGVYAFKRETLLNKWKATESYHEDIENLEQLRWLDNCVDIYSVLTDSIGFEINTQEDLLSANL